jgi:hypothetical protein
MTCDHIICTLFEPTSIATHFKNTLDPNAYVQVLGISLVLSSVSERLFAILIVSSGISVDVLYGRYAAKQDDSFIRGALCS